MYANVESCILMLSLLNSSTGRGPPRVFVRNVTPAKQSTNHNSASNLREEPLMVNQSDLLSKQLASFNCLQQLYYRKVWLSNAGSNEIT